APVNLADQNQIGLRIIGGTVPLCPAPRTGTEVDRSFGRKRHVGIFNPGGGRAVKQLISREIEAVDMPILWRERQHFSARPGRDDGWRSRYVPVVPSACHDLEVISISAVDGVQDDDRPRVEILAFPYPGRKSRSRVARRYVKQS